MFTIRKAKKHSPPIIQLLNYIKKEKNIRRKKAKIARRAISKWEKCKKKNKNISKRRGKEER